MGMKTAVFAALAVSSVILAIPTSAKANGLGDLLNVMTTGSNVINGCSYMSGLSKISCRLNEVASLQHQAQYRHQEAVAQRREKMDQQGRINNALARACKAGDTASCDRVETVSTSVNVVASALLDACQAGDVQSCRRMSMR